MMENAAAPLNCKVATQNTEREMDLGCPSSESSFGSPIPLSSASTGHLQNHPASSNDGQLRSQELYPSTDSGLQGDSTNSLNKCEHAQPYIRSLHNEIQSLRSQKDQAIQLASKGLVEADNMTPSQHKVQYQQIIETLTGNPVEISQEEKPEMTEDHSLTDNTPTQCTQKTVENEQLCLEAATPTEKKTTVSSEKDSSVKKVLPVISSPLAASSEVNKTHEESPDGTSDPNSTRSQGKVVPKAAGLPKKQGDAHKIKTSEKSVSGGSQRKVSQSFKRPPTAKPTQRLRHNTEPSPLLHSQKKSSGTSRVKPIASKSASDDTSSSQGRPRNKLQEKPNLKK